jgi:LacI family transcriptional regulator
MKQPSKRRSRRRRSAPTLDDVAKHAGVSSMTVSRVINGAMTVRESTRARVEAAIEEIGYAPNEAARSLAGASQLHIAMVYAKPHAYIAEFLFGGLEQARRYNAQFIVEKCADLTKIEAEFQRMVSEGIDGLLIAPPIADSDRVLDMLESSDIPAVVVTSAHVRDSISAVRIDGYKAAHEMTRHIISLGHRDIGFIVGDPKHATSMLRLAGFRDAMNEAGLDCPEERIAQGLFTYRSGLDAAEHLLSLYDIPTAIFASNDDMAAATVAVAHRHGLDVPGDLTLCGFDDTPLATEIWPQLTTIHVPVAELSRAAADLLVKTIRARQSGEERQPEHLVIDYTLIRRQSDAAPRIRPRVQVAEIAD